MNASTADGRPPLPPGFGADDGPGAWIGQASATNFEAYLAAARLVRLLDPTRAFRRVASPAGQPPFAVPDLDRRNRPTVTFACDFDAPRHDDSSHTAPSATPSSPDPRSPPSSPPRAAGSAIPPTGTTSIPTRASPLPMPRSRMSPRASAPDACTLSLPAPRMHAGLLAAPTPIATRRQLNLRRVPSSTALHRETSRFYAFKAGDLAHVPVYARRIAAALRAADIADFDAVVPVPLSPDRAAAGAPHRTLALARALSRALGIPALELLRLTASVTKHGDLPPNPRPRDISAWQSRYAAALVAVPVPPRLRRILVVDDAVARGCTLATCIGALPEGTAYGATAVRFAAPETGRSALGRLLSRPRPPERRTRLSAPRPASGRLPPTTPETIR